MIKKETNINSNNYGIKVMLTVKQFCFFTITILFLSTCKPKEETVEIIFNNKPEVPNSILKEHEHLLESMRKITLYPDSTGTAAIKLYELMLHHFREEEDYVLPPLGLLPFLTDGNIPENSKDVILLTEKLKSQLTHMNAEHQMIKAYIEELLLIAKKEQQVEILVLEKEIHKHAVTEEEVNFPAAILIGEYLKQKIK